MKNTFPVGRQMNPPQAETRQITQGIGWVFLLLAHLNST